MFREITTTKYECDNCAKLRSELEEAKKFIESSLSSDPNVATCPMTEYIKLQEELEDARKERDRVLLKDKEENKVMRDACNKLRSDLDVAVETLKHIAENPSYCSYSVAKQALEKIGRKKDE